MMRVDGDSMKDAGILNGDLLVVDRAAKPVNGSVVVVAVNGEYTVKRLRRCADCVWLEPANPRYQPIRVGIGEELHVFGVVRHAIHTCDEQVSRHTGWPVLRHARSPVALQQPSASR